MSFRARLTRFFVLIVVIPMIAVGFLVFRLISESGQAKTDARANGVLSAATSLYRSESITASADARSIARELSSQAAGRTLSTAQIRNSIATLAAQSGLARIVVSMGSRPTIDIGDRTALAPGSATVRGRRITVNASELTAAQYVREVAVTGAALLVRE